MDRARPRNRLRRLLRVRSGSIGLVVVVVLVLAALQLHSVIQMRDADVVHTRQVGREGAEGVAWDFNHELARAYDWFRPDPAGLRGDRWDAFAAKHAAWRAKAPQPQLFRAWYLVVDDGGRLALRRFDPASGRFPAAAWTAELAPIRFALAADHLARRLGGLVGAPPPARLEPAIAPELDVPAALLVPLVDAPPRAPAGRPAYGYAIGLLDMDFIRGTLLRAYGLDNLGPAYDLELRRARDPAAVLMASAQPHPVADFEVSMFRVGFVHLDDVFADADEGLGEGLWRLRVTHRDGSIAAHVALQRRRDVILTGAVMALLVASLGLLVASARRAHRLASQQLTFVAGITHELRTPLAVIRSAAENLTDGLVVEAGHVRRYGQLLLGEGRRLSHMVEQAIDFAALEAGRRSAPQEVYDVAALVEELVASHHADVTTCIAAPLPPLCGDPAATRLVLGNLVENARKHAPGSPIAIQVDSVEWTSGAAVRIAITDRGAGIDAHDVPHLFEPFYRGRRALDEQVPGSGLGLSVVKHLIEQQHGTIAVRSQPGQGATFIVHLPGGAWPS